MDIFKLPPAKNLGKRKLPEEPSYEALKKYRVEDGGARESGRTTIEDVPEDGDSPEAAGPELPPEDDFEDEEGGRMYGGGVSSELKKVFEVVDQLDEEDQGKMDLPQLKRLVLKFEKALAKNEELRVKFADEPLKFMESEADLDEQVHALMAVTSAPQLYPELIKTGTVGSILGLLSHENTDIVLSAIELLDEVTDEEIVPDEDGEAQENGVKELVKALVEGQALELVVQNLTRLDENRDEDRKGVFGILGFIENVIAVDSGASSAVVAKTQVLPFLLRRIQAKGMDSNKQYASEMLAILLQADQPNRLKFCELGGVDIALQCLAPFRKKDPKDDEETEFMENLFDATCAVLQESLGKAFFLQAEGLELMLMMLKAKLMSRMRALRVVNYALAGSSAETGELCRRFVDILGLKTVFAIFMRKGTKALRKQYKAWSEVEEDEHAIAIIATLFSHLFASEEYRSRLLGKFEEEQFEKVDRLAEMWETYVQRMDRVEKEVEDDELDLDEDDRLARRLEGGLFTLQQCANVIGYLALARGDRGQAYEHLLELVERRKQQPAAVVAVLREMADQVEGGEKARLEELIAAVGEAS
ncbi:Catenin-beta-like protein [Hyaloraphidium curvatum]|nr:Catenin-beta-like protein [Hyaloraphidium curvatum]